MSTRKKIGYLSLVLAFFLMTLAMPANVAASEPTINLGTTEGFAVLAGTTITNTGPTVISGDAGGSIGVSPGSSITGFPPGIVENGTIQINTAEANQAKEDLIIAYDDAAGRPVTDNLTGQDLGGMTLTTGVYFFSSTAQLTGNLTLDAEGDPEAVFIFQIGTALTTASNSSVSLINGAKYCRIFWQVGSDVTLGTGTDFIGHVFALNSIWVDTNATVQGQLLARNGEVTLDSNIITNGPCEPVPTPEPTETVSPTSTPTDETDATDTTDATDATTAETDATDATTTDQNEIPKTGETSILLVVGLILIGLALSLTYILYRSRSR